MRERPALTDSQIAAALREGYGLSADYRYEWVVQEIGDYAERVFLTDELGVATKADAVRGLKALFDPGDVVGGAYASEWA